MAAAPKTYTFSEFHQATGKDHAGYTKYLSYVANFRANKLAHQADAPYNSDALAPIPTSVGVANAHQMAHSEISPLLGASNAAYNQDVNAATGSLANYSKSLAAFYQPQSQEIMHNTQAATGAMAGANAALGSTLSAGPAGMGDLQHYLGAMGEGSAPQQQAVSGFGTTGQNLLAARGVSAINGMTGAGTAEANSAAFLPTLAAESGKYRLGNALSSFTNAHNKDTQNLLAQEPGVFAKLYQQFVNEEIQKAVARNSGYGAQVRAQTSAANNTRTNAGKTYTDPTTGRTTRAGYEWKNGREVRIPTASTTPLSGPGSKRYASYQHAVSAGTATVKQLVVAASKPVATTQKVPNPLGPGLPPVSQKVTSRLPNYNGTVTKIIATITPILSPYMGRGDIIRFAQRIVNGYYPPGQYGRPGTGHPRGK